MDFSGVSGQVNSTTTDKPSALNANECNNDSSGSEEEEFKESDVGEEDDEELDSDEDDGNNNLSSIDEDTKNKLMNKLPDLEGIKEPKQCVHPDPTGPNIVRGDGMILNDAKVDKCLEIWRAGTNQLNNLFPTGCSPNHPGRLCVVHVNCADENIYDVSVVHLNTHTALMSILNLRESIKLMNVGLWTSLKRHWFYWEEYKVSPPDQGQYQSQRQAELDVALLSNLLCVPTHVIARSSTKSFVRGPFTIERTDNDVRPNEHLADMMWKPYGASKYHEINEEWVDEFHGRVPVRKMDLTKVKCLVLIEKEGVFTAIYSVSSCLRLILIQLVDIFLLGWYQLFSGILARDHGCISVLTGGNMSRYLVWFIRAIKVRDPEDKIELHTMSDMDTGGIKIAHQLSKDWNENTISFQTRSRGDYLYLRYKTCWMGVYPTEYHRLRQLAPMSGVYKPMSKTDAQHNGAVAWRNNNLNDINFAGNGAVRLQEIDRFLHEDVVFNIAKIPPHVQITELGTMLINAICPNKWKRETIEAKAGRKDPPELVKHGNTTENAL